MKHDLLSLSAPELEDHLGYWLRRVSNPVSFAFSQALQARQLSVAEWVAMRLINGHKNVTPGDLAYAMGMTRGAVSKVLDKLETKRWAMRAKAPDDSRVHLLSLTPEGEHVLPELTEIADYNDHRFFGCLSENEQATLKALLQKLTESHHWSTTPVE